MDAATDLSLFPLTAGINSLGHLTIAGHDLVELTQTYTSPLYIYDGATIRAQLSRLQNLLKQYYPGPATVAYASKAISRKLSPPNWQPWVPARMWSAWEKSTWRKKPASRLT